MNWTDYRLIDQNKATKLRLQYLYINRAKCLVTESKRSIDQLLNKVSFLFDRFPWTKENWSAKRTRRSPLHSHLSKDFLPADSSHNFHEIVLCPDWSKVDSLPVSPLRARVLRDKIWLNDQNISKVVNSWDRRVDKSMRLKPNTVALYKWNPVTEHSENLSIF